MTTPSSSISSSLVPPIWVLRASTWPRWCLPQWCSTVSRLMCGSNESYRQQSEGEIKRQNIKMEVGRERYSGGNRGHTNGYGGGLSSNWAVMGAHRSFLCDFHLCQRRTTEKIRWYSSDMGLGFEGEIRGIWEGEKGGRSETSLGVGHRNERGEALMEEDLTPQARERGRDAPCILRSLSLSLSRYLLSVFFFLKKNYFKEIFIPGMSYPCRLNGSLRVHQNRCIREIS